MISSQLQSSFLILEMATFLVWQEADEKEKETIVKNLAKLEAEAIISDINKQVKEKYGSLQEHKSKLGQESSRHCEVA